MVYIEGIQFAQYTNMCVYIQYIYNYTPLFSDITCAFLQAKHAQMKLSILTLGWKQVESTCHLLDAPSNVFDACGLHKIKYIYI